MPRLPHLFLGQTQLNHAVCESMVLSSTPRSEWQTRIQFFFLQCFVPWKWNKAIHQLCAPLNVTYNPANYASSDDELGCCKVVLCVSRDDIWWCTFLFQRLDQSIKLELRSINWRSASRSANNRAFAWSTEPSTSPRQEGQLWVSMPTSVLTFVSQLYATLLKSLSVCSVSTLPNFTKEGHSKSLSNFLQFKLKSQWRTLTYTLLCESFQSSNANSNGHASCHGPNTWPHSWSYFLLLLQRIFDSSRESTACRTMWWP